uniref:endo-polygalacturonase n=1 Tax=Apolygus lucorum TaxID=248454 RepID=A0A060D4E1_APOLU|nr:polygalacturonase PG3-4 [Apolygus lucorum]
MNYCVFALLISVSSAAEIWNLQQLDDAKKAKDKNIILRDIQVPAGKALELQGLPNGTSITFAGRITFGYKEWKGPLVIIKGHNFHVEGKPGHVIDGEGHRWWDGLGGNGGKIKPCMIYVQLTHSKVKNIKVKNSPAHCWAINACRHVIFEGIVVDDTDGHAKGGHNTDGFDIARSHHVKIKNSWVNNQDDCLALNSGTFITFENNTCEGGHGIAVAVGGYSENVAKHVNIRNCKVIKNNIGIRVKTLLNGKGIVKDINFDNVELKDISQTGIVIIGNYLNSGPRGEPTGDLPIQDLTINNVRGNVLRNGTNIQVWVKNGSNWKWNSQVVGGTKKLPCQGVPKGVNIQCG